MTSPLSAESRPLVGSSRNKMSGLVTSRLATLSRFFWPPLRPFLIGVPTIVCACDCRPKLAMRSSTRRNASRRVTLLGSASRAAKIIVSRTVILPMSASSCSTYADTLRITDAVAFSPLAKIVPVVTAPAAAGRCANAFSSVVLPEPLGPISASISPAWTMPADAVRMDSGSRV